jgi:hypothetical protein
MEDAQRLIAIVVSVTIARKAMTSDNCSKLMCRSAIFFQME